LIENLRDYDQACLGVSSRDVLAKIRAGDKSWETLVPLQVAKIIRERNLFGCKSSC
jgi:nicotinic acid mononucleotide adenylyltransferase